MFNPSTKQSGSWNSYKITPTTHRSTVGSASYVPNNNQGMNWAGSRSKKRSGGSVRSLNRAVLEMA